MKRSLKLPAGRGLLIRRAIYTLAMVLIAVFLWNMGPTPWRHAAERWPIMLALVIIFNFGLVVQTMAFRLVTPAEHRPKFTVTLAIWAISAALSVVAPFMAGIAARTTLLVNHGMSLKDCGLSSLRQVWLGLEYALLLSALALPFVDWEIAPAAGGICVMAWLSMLILRLKAGALFFAGTSEKFRSLILAFNAPVPHQAHYWFVLQVLTMSAVYLTGFNGFGAEISLAQAIALSGLTVILSLIVFVPNGLGLTDPIWILFAKQAGITLEEAVAIAITLRLSHLFAATTLAALLNKPLQHHISA